MKNTCLDSHDSQKILQREHLKMGKELEGIQTFQKRVYVGCCSKVSRVRRSPCVGERPSRKEMSHLRHMMNGVHHTDATDTWGSSICVLGLLQSFNEAEPQLVYSCHSSAEGPSKWQQHPSQPRSCFWTQLLKSVAEVPRVPFPDVTSIINSFCAPIWT